MRPDLSNFYKNDRKRNLISREGCKAGKLEVLTKGYSPL